MVVFPSWLPFFLYDSSRKDKTQRNTQHTQKAHATQYATTKDAKKTRNARKKPAHCSKFRVYPANTPQTPPN